MVLRNNNTIINNNVTSAPGNAELQLIVMCNLYCMFSCICTLKSCKPKLYCCLNDKADFCTVCHMLD